MNIVKRVQLDLRKNTNKIIDIAKQWDKNSRTIEFEIIEDGNPLQIDSTLCRAEIAMLKPDNQQILNDCVIDNNIVSITFTEQMLASEGIANGEIRIYDLNNNDLCISSTFKIRISKSVIDDIKIQSTYEYNALTNAILSINKIKNEGEDVIHDMTDKLSEMDDLKNSLIDNENIRIASETQRETNENVRITNETQRIANETNRISQMNDMETGFDTAITNAETAISTAITNAETAINEVDSVKIEVVEATKRANNAAEACENINIDFINDNEVNVSKTWSSQKISSKIEEVKEMSNTIDTILSQVYPVGSIYMNAVNVNPGTLFGGTWVYYGKGRTLVGVDVDDEDFNEAGKTGGEKTQFIKTSELPGHTHTVPAHAHGLNSHTHSIPSLSIASSGSHTHSTTAAVVNNIMSVSSIPLYWISKNAFAYGSSNGAGGIRPSGSGSAENIAFTIPSLSISSSGAHTHTTTASNTGASSGNTANSSIFNSGYTGSGEAHNNMPPYITCYMWLRTA